MRSLLFISVFTCIFSNLLFSQATNSGSVISETEASKAPDLIIIPVVIHIVYNTPDQNISNDQVKSQITVLNNDYRAKNPDATFIPASFKALAGDSRIEFRLATTDPSGLPTSGIVRKNTNVTGFAIDDKVKYARDGGDDAWDKNDYLNIWICNLTGGVMGYASLPTGSPEKDGVVIRYTAFGTTANVKVPYHKGRTTVHEVGHWLGLRHIWGDADCGDDHIDDTPPQKGPTRGCPSGVVATCTSGSAGNMYMNFMDFTNDECTNMFTHGQVSKMRELFNGGGARVAMLSSDKADGAVTEELLADVPTIESLSMYPNPAVNSLNIRFGNDAGMGKQLTIYNHLGQIFRRQIITQATMQVDVQNLKAGMYYVSVGGGKARKFVKA